MRLYPTRGLGGPTLMALSFAVAFVAAFAAARWASRPNLAPLRAAIASASAESNLNPRFVEAVADVSVRGFGGGRPMSRPVDSGGGSAGASPAEDIDAGCRALARCAESAGWRRSLTLAAWREGEQAVQGWIDACPQLSESALVDAFATEETRRFTRDVLDRWAELEPPPESPQARR